MGERDTYQIVLQLKDELSANLKQVNNSLDQTRIAGQRTAEGVSGFTQKIRSAIQPVRDFTRVLSSIMAAGGIVGLLMRVANSIGDMEKAYAKLHPESQRAAGSLATWNAAMLDMKAKQGEVVSTILGPIREAFLRMIDPVDTATRAMTQFVTKLDEMVAKYKSEETKKLEERAKMLDVLTDAQIRNYDAMRMQAGVAKELAAAEKALAKIKEDYNKILKAPGAAEAYASERRMAEYRLETARKQYDLNQKEIANTRALIIEIPKIVIEQDKSTKTVKETTEAEKLMNEYLKANIGLQKMRLEVAQDYMDVIDQIYQIETERMKQSARAQVITPIGRTTPSGLRFLDPYANAELAEAADELTRVNDQLAKMLSTIPAVIIETKTLAETLRDEFEQLFKDMIGTTLVGIFRGLGEAAAGVRDFASAMADLAQQILDTLGTFMIRAGLQLILNPATFWLGLALLAAGGLTLIGAGAAGAGRQTQGIPNPLAPSVAPPINPYRAPGMAGNIGGIIINAPNARYLDARTAGQLVKMGLAAMRA